MSNTIKRRKVIGRKAEWLKTDGSAWIDTMIPIDPDNVVKVNFWDTNTSETPSINTVLYWTRHYLDNNYNTIMAGAYSSLFMRLCHFTNGNPNKTENGELLLYYNYNITYNCEFKKNIITVNGTKYPVTSLGYDDLIYLKRYCLYIIYIELAIKPMTPCGKLIWTSLFEVVGKISLTPILLTSPLPASLDSQGKARPAGEAGMWDSVSGKFYGNANTAGAFSVENLLDEWVTIETDADIKIADNGVIKRLVDAFVIENGMMKRAKEMWMLDNQGAKVCVWENTGYGVEIYEWLRGDGKAWIDSGINATSDVIIAAKIIVDYVKMQGDVNDTVLGARDVNIDTHKITGIDCFVNYANYYSGQAYYISTDYNDGTQGTIINRLFYHYTCNTSISIYLSCSLSKTNNVSKVNDIGYFNTNRSILIFNINQNSDSPFLNNRCFCGCIGSISIGTSEFYPCKLTKTILPTNAADGKAHSANECGMWDNKNKKFYANSSTEGAFSVEGNLIVRL